MSKTDRAVRLSEKRLKSAWENEEFYEAQELVVSLTNRCGKIIICILDIQNAKILSVHLIIIVYACWYKLPSGKVVAITIFACKDFSFVFLEIFTFFS